MRTAVGLIVRMRRPRSPSGSRTYGLLGFDTVIVIDDFSTDRSANLIQSPCPAGSMRCRRQQFDVPTRLFGSVNYTYDENGQTIYYTTHVFVRQSKLRCAPCRDLGAA